MFDGLAIKAGETANLEGENGEVFHLSQACLSDPKDAGKSYLKIKEGDRSLVVCCLQKDKNEHAALDIFVHPATNSFSVEGKNDIHLVGYWEPHGESDNDEDELDFMADEAEESDEAGESDLDDEIPSLLNGDRTKKPQGMPSAAKAGDEDESDEEDDEEHGESDDESEMPVAVPQTKAGKGLQAGVSANKQKPSQQPKQAPKSPALKQEAQPAKAAAGKAKATPKAAPKVAAANESQASQKRKPAPAEKTSTQPPAKQAKTAATPAAAGKGTTDAAGDDKFQSDLTEYLTKHGRTTMSELGSKVKKPAGVAKKLAAFLKDRTNLFKVDGTHVEMAK